MTMNRQILFGIIISLFTASCVWAAPLDGHIIGKKTPLVFEVEVTQHRVDHEIKFWIKQKGVYKILYSWDYSNSHENPDLGIPRNLVAEIAIIDKSNEIKIVSDLKLPDHPAFTGMDLITFNASEVGVRVPLTLKINNVHLKNQGNYITKGKLKVVVYRFNHRWSF